MLHHATSSHTSMTYYVYHCNICLNIASCNRPLCRTCESLQGMTAATWPRHDVAVSLTREIQELHVRYLRKQQTKALCSWHRLSHRFSICTVAHRGPAANSLKLLEPRQKRRNQADFKRSVLKNREKVSKLSPNHQNPVKSPDLHLIPLQKGCRPISLHHQMPSKHRSQFHSRTQEPRICQRISKIYIDYKYLSYINFIEFQHCHSHCGHLCFQELILQSRNQCLTGQR